MNSSAERSETGQHDAAPEMKGVLVDSRTVACGILFSRITGFGRIAAAAAVLGPTFFGNLFQTAAILPSSLYGVLIGVMISSVLVPPMVRRKNENGSDGVRRLAGAALGALTMVLLSVAVVGALAAPLLLRVLTITVSDPEIRSEQVSLGVPLLIMLIPQVVLYGIAGVGSAVQQAHGRFALPAIAPAVENLVNIIVLGTSAFFFGAGTDVTLVSLPQLMLLGLGTTAAVTIHACVQWIGAYRVGVLLLPRFDWRDPELRQILRRGASSTGYSGLYWAAYLLMLVVGGNVPGGVAALQIALSLCQFPVALTAVPLAEAQLPRLSTNHERQEMQAFGSVYESGLRLLMFIMVPAGLIAMTLPRMLAGAGAFGAMNSPWGISIIAACLGGLALGMVGEAAYIFTSTACYALHDTIGPLRAMGIRLALAGSIAAVVLLTMPSGEGMLWMVGASLAAANLVAGAYLCRRLRSTLPPEVVQNSGLVSALFVSAIALIPALLLTYRLDSGTRLVSYQRFGFALAMVGLTMAVYLAIQSVRGSRELRLLLPAIGLRWAARPPPAGL